MLDIQRMTVTGLRPGPVMQDTTGWGPFLIFCSKTEACTVLKSLAESLSHQPWTVWDIRHHLEQRLPSHFRSRARALASELKARFPGAAAPDAQRLAGAITQSQSMQPVLRDARRRRISPDVTNAACEFLPAPALSSCALPPLTTPRDLADWLALRDDQLVRFSDPRGLSALAEGPFAPHYRHHLHPKRCGALRLIEEPKPILKRLQRRILGGLLCKVPPHPSAFGFCAGRNCAQAAAHHAGEAMVVCFDLAGFFASIAQHRVYGVFRTFGYPAAVSRHLTGLCTAVTPPDVLARPDLADRDRLTSRHLPQGAPTSPALANMVAFTLDTRLAGLARSIDANYTRYADDLTFSGDAHIAPILQRAVPQIVQACGFTLNRAKTRRQPHHTRQTVTGLVVNQHLNMPRPEYDRLKAAVHHLREPADPNRRDRAYLDRLIGRIAWLESVNPGKGAKLRERLAEALAPIASE